VRCGAHQRLCRYITRPAIANERLKCNQSGQVVLHLKSPYRDGTTHIVMWPLQLIQRLAALVPRPRLIRFHGVLAPHATLRAQIVPSEPVNVHEACDHHAQTPPALAPARVSWACLLRRVWPDGKQGSTHERGSSRKVLDRGSHVSKQNALCAVGESLP
jgi:Putative transposase